MKLGPLCKKRGGIGKRGSRTAVSTRKSDMAIQVVYPPFPPPCSVDCPFYVLLSPKVEVSAIRFFDGLPPPPQSSQKPPFSCQKMSNKRTLLFCYSLFLWSIDLGCTFSVWLRASSLPPSFSSATSWRRVRGARMDGHSTISP